MRLDYLFKKLGVLSFWFISVCTLFIFSFIILFQNIKGLPDAILGALLTLITLTLVSFANILWLYLFNKPLLTRVSQKKIYYILSYFFSIFVFLLVVITYNFISHQATSILDIVSLVVVSVFVNTLIIIFHNYFVLQDAKTNADIENSHLKVANAEAANQLLRQQIHPHFFFNALSILKSLYKLDPEAAEEYLVSLSGFLRASLSSNNIKIISLKDEVQLCNDYLNMQKIRFGEALLCTIEISETALENGFVPSFSIQPLLENAIKHNELTKASPLHISVKQSNDLIFVSNNIKAKVTSETSNGIGLVNLSERYRILSGDEVIIRNDGVVFSVGIKIYNRQILSAKVVASEDSQYNV